MTPEDIKELRDAIGESQDAFARRLGVTGRTVYRWEAGDSVPSLYYLHRMKRIRGQINRERSKAG